jgi:hypothetical protein
VTLLQRINGYSYFYYCVQIAEVPVDSVLEADHYNFMVVLSTEPDLHRSFFTSVFTPLPAPNVRVRSHIQACVQGQEEPSSFIGIAQGSQLSSTFSIFSSDKTYSNLGLWALRCILSQHDSFAKVIQQTKMVQLQGGMAQTGKSTNVEIDSELGLESFRDLSINSMDTATRPAPTESIVGSASKELILQVDSVSLTTFCVLLYYIYTGNVNRTVDTSCFVLGDTSKV